MTIYESLRNALQDGLAITTRFWEYRTKSWVTSICAVDINGDGESEVVICSREGRVYVLTAKGDLLWKRVIGIKASVVGAVALSGYRRVNSESGTRIIVGTWDGKVYMLDKDGNNVSNEGKLLSFNSEGVALDPQKELEACWYDTQYAIHQVYVNAEDPAEILIGSSHFVYSLDYMTGKQVWNFETGGGVRAILSCDINNDGQTEILVGSIDGYLSILNQAGKYLGQYFVGYPIYALAAADVDGDDLVEILVGSGNKTLLALNYTPGTTECTLQPKWQQAVGNRLHSLCISDIDSDKSLEIIAGSADEHIYILNAQGKILWKYNHSHRVKALFVCDLNNDGVPELLVGADEDKAYALSIRLRDGIK